MIVVRLNGIILLTRVPFRAKYNFRCFLGLEPVNICCFKDRVKFIDPLMGTETIHGTYWFRYNLRHVVKLNNPHSGPVLISKTRMSTKI